MVNVSDLFHQKYEEVDQQRNASSKLSTKTQD